ncbi:MAG: type III pantothenate kinase [Burkholderiaceae bacterium]
MIVLIDAGNTRAKFGSVMPDGQREPIPLALRHTDLDTLADWLRQLPQAPTAALGVNVAGTAAAAAITARLAVHGCSIRWISSQNEAAGIRNAYDRASQLGADRWVSLIGLAWHARSQTRPDAHNKNTRHVAAKDQPPLMLASFGTATTIDTLAIDTVAESPSAARPHSSNWLFLGGVIFPGATLMRSSLAGGTANLPEASGVAAAYPTNTHQAIVTGIAAAQAGAVLRQWLTGLEHSGQAPRVYSSGGAWPIVKDETQRLLTATQQRMGLRETPIEWLPSPVLDGLAVLALGQGSLRAG